MKDYPDVSGLNLGSPFEGWKIVGTRKNGDPSGAGRSAAVARLKREGWSNPVVVLAFGGHKKRIWLARDFQNEKPSAEEVCRIMWAVCGSGSETDRVWYVHHC